MVDVDTIAAYLGGSVAQANSREKCGKNTNEPILSKNENGCKTKNGVLVANTLPKHHAAKSSRNKATCMLQNYFFLYK